MDNENSVVISNLPSRDRDDEDLNTLLYVGLCLPVDDIQIKRFKRDTPKRERSGNITVEFETLDQKKQVQNDSYNLRTNTTKSTSVQLKLIMS